MYWYCNGQLDTVDAIEQALLTRMDLIMKSVQHYELDQNSASSFDADTDCRLRVTSGRVWLTLEGQLDDVWLNADAEYAIAKGSTVWLGAEPAACIALVSRNASARGISRRLGRWWAWLSQRNAGLGLVRTPIAK